MARRCYVCGRGPMTGHNISHAHNLTKRRFIPNLHNIRIVVGGAIKRAKVCTRCLRSGRVRKAV